MDAKIGRQKVGHVEWTTQTFWVAVTVGQQRHYVGRVPPLLPARRLVHPDELPQC